MIKYDEKRYETYMQLPNADEVKKHLELKSVLNIVNENPNISQILDIGTATGRYPILFAKKGYEVTGIDISKEALSVASSNIIKEGISDRVNLFQMDATELDFPENSFDLITCMMGTISHVNPDKYEQFLKKVKYLLKPRGFVIISSWDSDCSFTKFLSFYNEQEKIKLKNNSMPAEKFKSLMDSIFPYTKIKNIIPFSDEQMALFQPENEFDAFVDIQEYIYSRTHNKIGQMYLAIGYK
ncbi:class I SAM-dependent methyltransferase [Bacillus gaemokensis]|uniref:Methyltransferase domain-containing protein n=1 Tax=Bacillus gaemokensis TaxID=574375 RepID=A0A073K4V7_9BACI|nr:class I SAM-dependent methyltransferase [Bacillus gaemokensis]KEK22334.1 hypothetical protein BAGA_19725 [Bacillus gaemokensis]KYG28876.1 hypothetical protein AZF08_14250 [Bacillus gaemokensis]